MESDNNREVKRLWWNGNEGDTTLDAKDGRRMFFKSFHYGDHDENWVCLYDASGKKELERHNTRFIASIVWA